MGKQGVKRVKKRNEELKPFADIIKREKGEKTVKEKKRIDHLRTTMIAAMIKLIGIQENLILKLYMSRNIME